MFLLRIKKQLKMTNVQNMSLLLILRFSISYFANCLKKNELITEKTFGERGGGYIRRRTRHKSNDPYVALIFIVYSSYSGFSALIHKLPTNIALVPLVFCFYSPLNNKLSKNIPLVQVLFCSYSLILLLLKKM